MHIHYPRIWNALQDWFVNINARKAQVYFVFEHKNFFQGLFFNENKKELDCFFQN